MMMMMMTKNRKLSPSESILPAVYPSITMELFDLLCVRECVILDSPVYCRGADTNDEIKHGKMKIATDRESSSVQIDILHCIAVSIRDLACDKRTTTTTTTAMI